MPLAQSATSFFTDPKNPVVDTLDNRKVPDKILKVAIAVLNLLKLALEVFEAPDDVQRGVGTASEAAKQARTIFALFNIPAGIARLGSAVNAFVIDTGKFFENTSERTKETFDDYYKNPVSRPELAAHMAEKALEIVEQGTYVIAFGISRPINLIAKHFPSAVSESAKEIGQGFASFVLVHQVACIGKHTVQIVRAIDARYYKCEDPHLEENFEGFWKTIQVCLLKIVEKIFELAATVIGVFRVPAPPIVKPVLELVASGVGLFNVLVTA